MRPIKPRGPVRDTRDERIVFRLRILTGGVRYVISVNRWLNLVLGSFIVVTFPFLGVYSSWW